MAGREQSEGTEMAVSWDDRQIAEFHQYLNRICEAACTLLDAEGCSIFLLESDDELVMRAGFGCERDLVGVAKYRVGEGITGWIAENHRLKADTPEAIYGHERHAGKYDGRDVTRKGTPCRSLIGIPLLMYHRVFGVIKVANKRTGGEAASFSDEDLRHLDVFVQAILDGVRANEDLLHALGRLCVFVAMAFHERFRNVYQFGIRQAVERSSMRCERVDDRVFTRDTMEEVFARLRTADIVIADVTDRNANVFYEIGYAHALGKPSVFLAQSPEHVPFDLNHFPIMLYDQHDLKELQDKLSRTLCELRRELLKQRSQ